MNVDRNNIIGEQVRFHRTSQGRSLEYVCSNLPTEIGVQQMSRYETGQSRWPADLLVEVSILLKIDIKILTGIDVIPSKDNSSEVWKAEKYKNLLLNLPDRARMVIYKLIDGITAVIQDQDASEENTR